MTEFERLAEWFLQHGGRALVALSGGVDSAVVALAAKSALGDNALAITADYKTLAAEELESARRVAREIGITHMIIEYDELQNPEFVKNDRARCYHCRTELGQHLAKEAEKFNAKVIVDGTHLDDLSDYRPGIRALRENGVRCPLAELGIDKVTVRQIAKDHELSVHDRPSNACLASRIPAGMEVTYEKLRRIENAEIAVKSIFGVRLVRVRDHGDMARIEVGKDELQKVLDADKLALVDAKLKEIGFKFVAVDAAGYRQGTHSRW
jgi:pyridinium-3,5-biscarboxylic acid mononucleotide sulfurtransferase